MKKVIKGNIITFQFVGFIGVIALFPLIFSESSCNRIKKKETNSIVDQQNDLKFEKSSNLNTASFLVEASETYLLEIELAQLAQQRAMQVDIKELGRMNEDFYSKQLLSLKKLAKIKSITIPTSLNIYNKDIYKAINSKSDYAFDKAYCDQTITTQNRSIHFFEIINSVTADQDMKNWVTQSLPKMRQQLSYALICQRSINSRLTL